MGVGLRTRWIVEGTIQLTEVMAHLQLATAAIASAEAVGMGEIWMISCLLRKTPWTKARRDRPRTSS